MNQPRQRKNLSIEIEKKGSNKTVVVGVLAATIFAVLVGGILLVGSGGRSDARGAVAPNNSEAVAVAVQSAEPATTVPDRSSGIAATISAQADELIRVGTTEVADLADAVPVAPTVPQSTPPTLERRALLTASDSWIVLTRGPRSDENSKEFVNVQGRAVARFSSYGIIEFPAPGGSGFQSQSLLPTRGTLRIAQSVAQFSRAGTYSVWLVMRPITSRDLASVSFKASDGIGGIDPITGDLGPLIRLREGEFFSPVSTGHIDIIGLEFSADAAREVERRLRERRPIYVVLIAEDAEMAGTFAGSASTRADVPRLELFFD